MQSCCCFLNHCQGPFQQFRSAWPISEVRLNHKEVRAKKVVFDEDVSQEFESEKRCLASKLSLTRVFFYRSVQSKKWRPGNEAISCSRSIFCCRFSYRKNVCHTAGHPLCPKRSLFCEKLTHDLLLQWSQLKHGYFDLYKVKDVKLRAILVTNKLFIAMIKFDTQIRGDWDNGWSQLSRLNAPGVYLKLGLRDPVFIWGRRLIVVRHLLMK